MYFYCMNDILTCGRKEKLCDGLLRCASLYEVEGMTKIDKPSPHVIPSVKAFGMKFS